MITSFQRSAVAAAVVLAAVAALAGCGGDDDAGAAGDPSATPAWDSTPAHPGAAPTDAGESPGADGGVDPAGGASGDATGGGPAAGGELPGDPSGDVPDDPPQSGTDGGTADPSAEPFAQPIDACTLGVDAIAAVLGQGPTSEDLSDPAAFGPACAWTGAGGQEVVVSIAGYDDWVATEDLPGGGAQAVDDLGTEAWASLGAPSNAQVAWRRDDVSVAVAASLTSGGDTMLDVARAIDAALLAAGY